MATPLLQRRPLDARRTPPARLVVAGALGATRAVGLGTLALAVVVLVGWASTTQSGVGVLGALRAALTVWLLGHDVPLRLPTATVTLQPLGLLLLPAAAALGSARHARRSVAASTTAGRAWLAVSFSISYAVLAWLVAGLAGTPEVRAPAGPVFFRALGLAMVASVVGTGLLAGPRRKPPLPPPVRAVLAGGGAAFAILVAGASAVAALALSLHLREAAEVSRYLAPGALGGVLLTLGSAAAVPNAVGWSLAYVAGPGFTMGVGSTVSPFGVDAAPLPALPLLAALPTPGPQPGVLRLVLLVPVLAGLVAGLLVHRGCRGVTPVGRALLGAGAGVTAGCAAALLAGLSGGSLGAGRLAELGPSPWLTGLAVAVEVGVVAALTAAATARRGADGRARARRGP